MRIVGVTVGVVLAIACALWLVFLVLGFTLVLVPDEINTQATAVHKGDVIRPLEGFDFAEGHWCAYLIVSRSDFPVLPHGVPRRTCLKLCDRSLLGEMKKEWVFVSEGGDVATVESSIVIVHDDAVVFQSGIIAGGRNAGLQSSSYGWLRESSPGVVARFVKQFDAVYWPIVVL